jgi:5-methylcytosine-specific restriction endonuclease McrA
LSNKVDTYERRRMHREVEPKLRRKVFERDGNKCAVCYRKYCLDAHHFYSTTLSSTSWPYPYKSPYENTQECDLVTLCDSCHAKAHTCAKDSPFFALLQAIVIRNREKADVALKVIQS